MTHCWPLVHLFLLYGRLCKPPSPNPHPAFCLPCYPQSCCDGKAIPSCSSAYNLDFRNWSAFTTSHFLTAQSQVRRTLTYFFYLLLSAWLALLPVNILAFLTVDSSAPACPVANSFSYFSSFHPHLLTVEFIFSLQSPSMLMHSYFLSSAVCFFTLQAFTTFQRSYPNACDSMSIWDLPV